MSKTTDIESAIVRTLDDYNGRIALGNLMLELAWVDDRRWIGVAINLHLVKDGKVRYADCDSNHNHSDSCAIEAVR
jgi:hypothetical protein